MTVDTDVFDTDMARIRAMASDLYWHAHRDHLERIAANWPGPPTRRERWRRATRRALFGVNAT